jgi:hypothetical protein
MILITPTTTAALCLCSQKGLFGSERVGARHGQINCRAGKPRSSCSSRVLEHSRSKQPPHRAKKKITRETVSIRPIKNSQTRAERFMLAEQALFSLFLSAENAAALLLQVREKNPRDRPRTHLTLQAWKIKSKACYRANTTLRCSVS